MKVFIEMVYPLRCLTVLEGLPKISGFFVLNANETVNRLAKFQGKVTHRTTSRQSRFPSLEVYGLALQSFFGLLNFLSFLWSLFFFFFLHEFILINIYIDNLVL